MGIHEECGVFGIYSPARCQLAETVYYGLYALQHRGQESCGIVINDDGILINRFPLKQTIIDSIAFSYAFN